MNIKCHHYSKSQSPCRVIKKDIVFEPLTVPIVPNDKVPSLLLGLKSAQVVLPLEKLVSSAASKARTKPSFIKFEDEKNP